jgi:ATP-dependent exoDNAse (exonuclease V) beta subunit
MVVDYKTDAVEAGGEGMAADAHRGQTHMYEHAVQTAADARTTAKLLFARTGMGIEVA